MRIVIVIGGTLGLAEWIIDGDRYVTIVKIVLYVVFLLNISLFLIENMSKCITNIDIDYR